MFNLFNSVRKASRAAMAVLAIVGLSACNTNLGGLGTGPSIDTTAPVPVALLVPYGAGTAGEEGLARSLENAARMAMADLDGVQIDLRVYGTAGNAQRAAAQAQKAVNEGAKVILGPVFGEAANAAGVAVASKGVNVLSFSNNTEIAGGNVFVLGNTFENTAARVARYAASKGKSRVLIVHAETTAGTIAEAAVSKALSRAGARKIGSIGYPASQEGLIETVPLIADAAKSGGANAVFFTADTVGGLPLLSQLLPERGVKPADYQYLGLTRWDIPQQTLSLPGLQGGLFALPDPTLTAQFQNRYSARYGSRPHPLAGLAYDGIAAIGALVKQGKSNALTGFGLTQNSGFVGVNGVFRLRSNGTNDRALAVAQIVNRKVQIVSPAPKSFGFGGF